MSFSQQQIRDDLQDSITGYAYYKNDDCCGYLTVKLDGTPEAPYWVLELGPIVDDYYEYSIVSGNQEIGNKNEKSVAMMRNG